MKVLKYYFVSETLFVIPSGLKAKINTRYVVKLMHTFSIKYITQRNPKQRQIVPHTESRNDLPPCSQRLSLIHHAGLARSQGLPGLQGYKSLGLKLPYFPPLDLERVLENSSLSGFEVSLNSDSFIS